MHWESLSTTLHREACIDRGERLHLLFQHVSLPFELPDFCVHSAHMAWDTCRACLVLFLLKCTLLNLDFGLHVLELLFRHGEFCRRCLTPPLESVFGNAPLRVLLYELHRLAVKALNIRCEGGALYGRVCSCVPRTLARSALT
jgi:hypothetical protein